LNIIRLDFCGKYACVEGVSLISYHCQVMDGEKGRSAPEPAMTFTNGAGSKILTTFTMPSMVLEIAFPMVKIRPRGGALGMRRLRL
jgi:hypothetical protein